MKQQPHITVGIMDGRTDINGCLNGTFRMERGGSLAGRFSAKSVAGVIVLVDELHGEIQRSPSITLMPEGASTFSLSNVTIGKQFHWERIEDQTFQGNLRLQVREDGAIVVINEIPLEDYLTSVISSEMTPDSPMEFLKAHAILSRSWLLAALERKKARKRTFNPVTNINEGEVIRWTDREYHEIFDVCADDHCQRYRGLTKIVSPQVEEASRETHGRVITYQSDICDARYSKCCGGLTEEFATAWDDQAVPYLETTSDASVSCPPIRTEEEAKHWILSAPQAYCNTQDNVLLDKILSDFDRETKSFFRWTVQYRREELEEILLEKSGVNFGTLQEIVPLCRGSSGRISRLRIAGSKRSVVVGKELEIRRWLSRSHLYSSAFVVTFEGSRVIFQGAGWGHGVGLCQIGAAVMATQGFSAGDILKHYFHGVEIQKIY